MEQSSKSISQQNSCNCGSTIQQIKKYKTNIAIHCGFCGKFLFFKKCEKWQNYILWFGKYNGKTMLEISEVDCKYLAWLSESNKNIRLKMFAKQAVMEKMFGEKPLKEKKEKSYEMVTGKN